MKDPDLRKWRQPEQLQSLLFFGQAIVELLFEHTLDSFKASALNTHSAAHELRFLAGQLLDNRIASGTLIPIMEELEWRLKNDPVLSESTFYKVLLERLSNERTDAVALKDLTDALLLHLSESYWLRIREKIQTEVESAGGSKRSLLELANAFIVEAEIQGFSRHYIYHVAKRFFFWTGTNPSEIHDPSQIRDFLAIFYEGKPAKYTAIFRGSHAFTAISGLSSELGITISSDPPEDTPTFFRARRFLGRGGGFPQYLSIKGMAARDPNSARTQAEYYIEILADIYSYYVHDDQPSWHPTTLLINDETGWAELINAPASPMKRGTRMRAQDLEVGAREAIEVITGKHLTLESSVVFIKALDYHRAAVEAGTPENQLLDLWAALEGFLPPPSKDAARITHFVGALIPSLTLSYSEKLFRYIASDLERSNATITDVIADVPIGEDVFTRVVALLTTIEAEPLRKRLFSALELNPLLRFRCFSVHDQFRTNERIRAALSRHREKVGWHIQRIYATRNQIAHSAEALPYLDTLVENLHFYLDTLTTAIVRVARRTPMRTSVSSATKLLSLSEQAVIRDLSGPKVRCSYDNFQSLVFGSANVLAPPQE